MADQGRDLPPDEIFAIVRHRLEDRSVRETAKLTRNNASTVQKHAPRWFLQFLRKSGLDRFFLHRA